MTGEPIAFGSHSPLALEILRDLGLLEKNQCFLLFFLGGGGGYLTIPEFDCDFQRGEI